MGLPLFRGGFRESIPNGRFTIKAKRGIADTSPEMIISDEQVRRVVEYLHTPEEYSARGRTAVLASPSAELVDLVIRELGELPDVRADRVQQARELIGAEILTSDMVAGKLIGRVLSDSIR
ncbi:MAG: hypothetical protein D9V44_02560 [Actinobacteria bacterium]|nr:MAG: hypothetical protein D9V44_02560 [Actinomycetota bacterium]